MKPIFQGRMRSVLLATMYTSFASIAQAGDLDTFLSSRGQQGAPNVLLRSEGRSGPGARVEAAPLGTNPNIVTPPVVGFQSGAFKTTEGGSIGTSVDSQILTSGKVVAAPSTTTTVGGGGGCCVVPGTPILMADGSIRSIEDIGVGDFVAGLNGTANEVYGILVGTVGTRRLFSLNDLPHFITPEHPVLTQEGWKSFAPLQSEEILEIVPVSLLRVGDSILSTNGEVTLDQVTTVSAPYEMEVLTLQVRGDRTFNAHGLVVLAMGSYWYEGDLEAAA